MSDLVVKQTDWWECLALMQMHTTSMFAIMIFTKYGLVMHAFVPCLVNFIMADVEVVCICISAGYFLGKS